DRHGRICLLCVGEGCRHERHRVAGMAGWDRHPRVARLLLSAGASVGEYPCRLPSIPLVAPVATGGTRRHALMPFGGDTEVRDVRIADTAGNLFDRQASVEQKGARYLVPLRQ